MIITDYLADGDSDRLYLGKFSLTKEYRIDNADEAIYNYLGVNTARPLTALIHPDDLKEFLEAAEALSSGTQHVIMRLMSCNGNYRYMYFIMNHNGRVVDDFASITVEMQDIVSIHDKFEKVHEHVMKYRDMMSLSPNLYMEYSPDTDILQFYEYNINRSVTIMSEKLSTIIDNVENNGQLTDKQRAEFDVLVEKLCTVAGRAEVMIDGNVLGVGNCYLKIRMRTFTNKRGQKIIIAVVSRIDYSETDGEKYYMSSYAIDMATGVYNKRAISELAHDTIANAKDICYVIMMDVDDFKMINDSYGHLAGDQVMEKVASIINSVATNRGYVGRFGGDEFLLVLDRAHSDEEVIMMLKTMRKNMAWECKSIVPNLNITASIGIAKYPDHGTDYQRLFNAADKCVYIAKEKGKNRYIMYKPEIHGNIVQDDDLHGDLGINQGGLKRYQDVLDIILTCSQNGVERIRECMDNIRNTFGIDGIRIYDNVTAECKFMAGDYQKFKQGEKVEFLPELYAHLDGNGMLIANKIMTIMETCPVIYEAMEKTGVAGVLFLKCSHYTVEFAIFSRLRKWSDSDKGMMMMVGKIMDAVVTRNNN